MILGADDFSAKLAERYGYVNRALPDAEIEVFVEAFARRMASFEKHALVGAKALMNDVTLPADSVFPPALKAFFTSATHPATRARLRLCWNADCSGVPTSSCGLVRRWRISDEIIRTLRAASYQKPRCIGCAG